MKPFRQIEAEIAGETELLAVVLEVLAGRGLGPPPELSVLQDDVDDAGDGVGAVLGRRPVLKHFDVVDRVDGIRLRSAVAAPW